MKLKFDATLEYQLEAIQSVMDLSAQTTLFSTDFGKYSAAVRGDCV